MSKYSRIFFILIFIFFIVELSNFINGKAYDRAIAFGYFASLLYLVVLGVFRYRKIRLFLKPSLITFTILSAIGGIYVESSFWLGQQLFHTDRVALSNNLLVDFLMTGPYYTLLGYLFAKKNLQFKLSLTQVLFIGAIYEVIADGIVGSIFTGNVIGMFFSPLFIPIFAIVYSPIIFVPYKILSENSNKQFRKGHIRNIFFPSISILILPLSILFGKVIENFFR